MGSEMCIRDRNDAAHTAGSARTRVFVQRNARKSSMESSRKFSIKAYSMYTCIVCPPSASLRPQTHFTYDYSRKNGIKKRLLGRFLAKKGDKNVQKHGKNKQNEGKITSKQRKNGVNTYKKQPFSYKKGCFFYTFLSVFNDLRGSRQVPVPRAVDFPCCPLRW